MAGIDETGTGGRSRIGWRVMLGGLGSGVAASAIASALFAQPPSAAPVAPGPVACTVAAIQSAAPADTTITAAQHLDAPVRHCRIDGYVTATNPGPNRDNFRLQLPDPDLWAHRFFFIGVGGSGGSVPTDAQVPGGNPMLKGFAVAGTDKGHQTDALDWSFNNDPAKSLDNAHRAAHLTTVASQQITRAYYGTNKMYRYETGCSGGGDMGMKAMQFYPHDYDGVLLGWGGRHPDPKKDGIIRNFNVMIRESIREPGSWLSPAKRKFLEAEVMKQCDAADGAKDDMIWDSRQCSKIDFSKLLCKPGQQSQCLTQPELTTVVNIERNSAWPISNISSWSYMGDVPPPWDPSPSRENAPKTSSGYVIINGWARTHLNQPTRDILKDPLTEAELATMERKEFGQHLYPGGFWDLSAWEQVGGKSIFYDGVGDPSFNQVAMENWFRVWTQKIGAARRDKIGKLYEIPGWGHCGGGTGPGDGTDVMLNALIDWVEKGKAPHGLEMHRGADRTKLQFAPERRTEIGVAVPTTAGVSRDFLVCPYPLRSVFDRTKANVPGAVNEAKNWSCKPKPKG